MQTLGIILPSDTPYYVKSEGSQLLVKKDKWLSQGMSLRVGRIEQLIYDRRPEEAVPFQYLGGTYYILLRQLHIVGIKGRLRSFSNLHLVEKNDENS